MKNINNITWETDFQNRVYSLLKSLKYHWKVKKLPLCWVWHLFGKEVPKSLRGFIGGSEKTVNGDTVYWDNNGMLWTPTLDIGGSATEYAWGVRGEDIAADSSTDGQSNTSAIVAQYPSGNYAANKADELTYAGFSNWWLPAKDTLENFYYEAGETPAYDNKAQLSTYWSSTESTSDRAWAMLFSVGGIMGSDYKDNTYPVRCVLGPVYHIFSNRSPTDGATVSSKTLSVDVRHLDDGSTSDVEFWVDGSKVGTDTNVASGGTASYTASGLSSGDYNWYVIADDGTNTTQSATWSFTYGVSDIISKNVNLRF